MLARGGCALMLHAFSGLAVIVWVALTSASAHVSCLGQCRGTDTSSSFLDTPDHNASSQLVVTEGVREVILGLVPWLRSGAPVLLVAPEGCGKAMLLQHCLDQLPVCCLHLQHCTAFLASPCWCCRLMITCRVSPPETGTSVLLGSF